MKRMTGEGAPCVIPLQEKYNYKVIIKIKNVIRKLYPDNIQINWRNTSIEIYTAHIHTHCFVGIQPGK